MATSSLPSNQTTPLTPKQQHLAHLRNLAQEELSSIQRDLAHEQHQASAQELQIQRYAKITAVPRRKADNNTVVPNRRKPQRASTSPSPSPSPEAADTPSGEARKGSKLRPIQDVLHRLRWDPAYTLDEYTVGYLERFEGILEMPAGSFVRLSDDYSDEDWIPLHRVRYVKWCRDGGEVRIVWHRDERVDAIFGSDEKKL